MKKDCHVHTTISHDGISSMEEYLECAKDYGVDEITFTEHYDIYDGLETKLETLDVDNYYNKFCNIKNNIDLRVNFGVEVGLQPDMVNRIEKMISSYPFDFVIGSSHITCKKDMAMDKSFFDGLTRRDAYLKYFNEVLININLYNNFDVYGHLDYVVRYGGYDSKIIKYDEFREILDSILESLVKKDKGIEINTSGIRYGLGNPHPNIDIIKRYYELGGEIITIGSDAHKISDLSKDFNLVYEMLSYLGIDDVAFFHQRQPEFIKVKSLIK